MNQIVARFSGLDAHTRVQYALMVVFGAICVGSAFLIQQADVRAITVGTTFGLTAGLWLSHLIETLDGAIDESTLGGVNE